jgi:hypothetical protein
MFPASSRCPSRARSWTFLIRDRKLVIVNRNRLLRTLIHILRTHPSQFPVSGRLHAVCFIGLSAPIWTPVRTFANKENDMNTRIWYRVLFLFVAAAELLGLSVALYASRMEDGDRRHGDGSGFIGNPLQGRQTGFTPNRGQVADLEGRLRPDVLFTADLGSAVLYFTATGVSTVFSRLRDTRPISEANGNRLRSDDGSAGELRELFRLDMRLVGADPSPVVEAMGELPGPTNFYLAHCPGGITHVPRNARIVYKDVYKNIDLVYRSAGAGKVKYEFIVRPGGNPAHICMRYDGVVPVVHAGDGSLYIGTPLGSITESQPYVYQGESEVRGCEFTMVGDAVSFVIGEYDHDKTLVIDPWAQYLGGSAGDRIYNNNDGSGKMNQDASGNILLCGQTVSSNFPNLNGYQQIAPGGEDGYVSSFGSSGTLLWSTYFGGSGTDYCRDIAGDGSNNILVTGLTNSANIPLLNPYQSTHAGYDVFVAGFTSSGVLQWSSLYGGAGDDQGYGIRADGNGNIIVVGYCSAGFPVVTPHQSSSGGNEDGFIMKLTGTGTPQWATFFGGSENDRCTALELDGSGNIFVCGRTMSPNFPVSSANQATLGGGEDTFIAAWTSSGALTWSTYHGGGSNDRADDLCLSPSGDVYVVGFTLGGVNFPLLNQFSSYAGGTHDATLVRFSSAGTLLWSTCFGGSGEDTGHGVVVDAAGNVYITGRGNSVNLPMLNSFQSTQLNYDIFITVFSSNQTLAWSTYFGGNDGERGVSLLLNGGDLIVAGQGFSSDLSSKYGFPAQPGTQDVLLFSMTTSGNFPVELSSLSALVSGSNVRVSWSTESESNNLGFEVQRSTDPASKSWESRGVVPGAGNCTAHREYAFDDELPQTYDNRSSLFYRLRQIDTDGSIHYSGIVEAVPGRASGHFAILEVHPQPAQGEVGMRFSGNGDDVLLRLIDVLGRCVAEKHVSGRTHASLDVAAILPGAYILIAEQGQARAVRRILVRQ